MTMEDDTSSMVFQTGGYAAGGDFDKDLLWDGATFDFSNFNDDKELLQQFDLAGMDNISNVNSQTSSASVSEDTESKAVVMAAASAAGLNRGGLRRAAFSMGDLQALQPSAPSSAPPAVNSYHQSSGMPLEPVIEGVQTIMTSIPTSMPQQALPMYSYPIMQPQANQHMQMAMQQQRGPEQLTSLSIEQIEAQLQRTREAAAAGNMQAQQQMMQPQQQPQQQQFYSVVPQIVKTSPMYPQFQQGAVMMVSAPGQPSTMAPAAPLMAMAPPEPKPAAVGGLRRVQSAVELRRVSDDPSDPIPKFLQDETGDDGVVRIGKLTPEERRQKILRYRQKRHERNFKKKIKYVCRKTLADSRPRVRGRFARNDEDGAKPPPDNGSTSAQAPANTQAPATSVH